MNEREKKETSISLSTEFIDQKNIVVKTQPEDGAKDSKELSFKFNFDRIFNPNDSQVSIYEYAGKPVVDSK